MTKIEKNDYFANPKKDTKKRPGRPPGRKNNKTLEAEKKREENKMKDIKKYHTDTGEEITVRINGDVLNLPDHDFEPLRTEFMKYVDKADREILLNECRENYELFGMYLMDVEEMFDADPEYYKFKIADYLAFRAWNKVYFGEGISFPDFGIDVTVESDAQKSNVKKYNTIVSDVYNDIETIDGVVSLNAELTTAYGNADVDVKVELEDGADIFKVIEAIPYDAVTDLVDLGNNVYIFTVLTKEPYNKEDFDEPLDKSKVRKSGILMHREALSTFKKLIQQLRDEGMDDAFGFDELYKIYEESVKYYNEMVGGEGEQFYKSYKGDKAIVGVEKSKTKKSAKLDEIDRLLQNITDDEVEAIEQVIDEFGLDYMGFVGLVQRASDMANKMNKSKTEKSKVKKATSNEINSLRNTINTKHDELARIKSDVFEATYYLFSASDARSIFGSFANDIENAKNALFDANAKLYELETGEDLFGNPATFTLGKSVSFKGYDGTWTPLAKSGHYTMWQSVEMKDKAYNIITQTKKSTKTGKLVEKIVMEDVDGFDDKRVQKYGIWKAMIAKDWKPQEYVEQLEEAKSILSKISSISSEYSSNANSAIEQIDAILPSLRGDFPKKIFIRFKDATLPILIGDDGKGKEEYTVGASTETWTAELSHDGTCKLSLDAVIGDTENKHFEEEVTKIPLSSWDDAFTQLGVNLEKQYAESMLKSKI